MRREAKGVDHWIDRSDAGEDVLLVYEAVLARFNSAISERQNGTLFVSNVDQATFDLMVSHMLTYHDAGPIALSLAPVPYIGPVAPPPSTTTREARQAGGVPFWIARTDAVEDLLEKHEGITHELVRALGERGNGTLTIADEPRFRSMLSHLLAYRDVDPAALALPPHGYVPQQFPYGQFGGPPTRIPEA